MPQMLSIGSLGPDVVMLQDSLNSNPPTIMPLLRVDGIFGVRTLARVKEFQRGERLKVDGIVGPLTWEKLTGIALALVSASPQTGIAQCGGFE